MAKVTFRLTTEGKPSTWQLPQSNIMANKITGEGQDLGLKFINYFPGQDSCFVEDIKNKDIKPSRVPLFEFRPDLNMTVLEVDTSNKSLLNYLKTHPWYNDRFEEYSSEKSAEKKLTKFDLIEKCLGLLKDLTDVEAKAMAVAIIGNEMVIKTKTECLADLKNIAISEPSNILDIVDKKDYKIRYVSALAFAAGVVKTSMTNTEVLWSDTNGVICYVAQGEQPIDKLTKFLTEGGTIANGVIQEFRAKLKNTNKEKENLSLEEQIEVLKKKNEQLEALVGGKKDNLNQDQNQNKNDFNLLEEDENEVEEEEDFSRMLDTPNESLEIDVVLDESEDEGNLPLIAELRKLDIEELRSKYIDVYGSKPANIKINDKDWIIGKIIEKTTK